MKTTLVFLAGLVIFAAVVSAYPAEPEPVTKTYDDDVDEEKDVDVFPTRRFPFEGFLGGFNDLFERMRQQMLYLMSTVPRIGLGKTPEGGNTTSVTKIIDGHKVVINETVYTSSDGEDAAAVLKVRVVDIRPDDDAFPEEPDANNRSVESVEHSLENEIPKNAQQKRKVNSAETPFDDLEPMDNLETFDEPDNNLETFDEPRHPIGPFDSQETNVGNAGIDLTGDIYVNELAAQNGVVPNMDAEIIFPNPPRDLSNDINVNKYAQAHNFPTNPDAEIIGPFERFEYNRPDLASDTVINELAREVGVELNPDAEVIAIEPNNKYYYKTENS